jgi:hypothetical protein
VPKARKRRKKRLGIVPKALLGAAIAGAVPASVVPACSNESSSIDAGRDVFAVDAPNDRPAIRDTFAVDAPGPDAPIPDTFAVDAPSGDV